MKKNKKRLDFRPRKYHIIVLIYIFMCGFSVIPLMASGLPAPADKTGVYEIKGKITDEKGLPMPGVTIRLEGTQAGVVSDHEGGFTIVVPPKPGVLLISFIGYETKKVSFTESTSVSVKMKEEISVLDEVQVVAYGEQTRRETIGAIGTVKADALKDNATSDIINKLQGQLAGVAISNPTGAPGAQGSITIRGFNSLSVESTRIGSDPLWVIDGVPVYSNPDTYTGITPLSTIPAGDIERIDVLKDAASCAIYGSRAANGVILVKTRSGHFNEKFSITANVIQMFSCGSKLSKIFLGRGESDFRRRAFERHQEAVYDYETNTWHYVSSTDESEETGLHYDYFWNKGLGTTIPQLQDTLNPYFNNATNLFRSFFQVAKVTDIGLRFSGGSSTVAYNIGLGYYKERGALINTGFNRVNLSGNFNFKPHPKVDGRLNFAIVRTGINRSDKGMDPYRVTTMNTAIPKIPAVLTERSTVLPGKGTASYDRIMNNYRDAVEDNESYRFRTLFDLKYKIIEGLKIQSAFSFDYLAQHRNTYLPASVDEYSQSYSSGSDVRNISALNEDYISYEKQLGKHHLRALAGISFQLDQMNSISGYGYGENDYHYVTWQGSEKDEITKRQLKEYNSDKAKSGLVGIFGKIAYNYNNKYLVEANFRRDGSSRFGKNTRWGFFPSVAAGYTLSEENFMKNISHIISYSKFRFSWGRTGKQFDSPYVSQGVYGPGSITYQGKPTITTVDLPNPDLTWEETDQYNAGLDMDFLDYRFSLTVDYYYRYTDDLLNIVRIPGNHTGFPWGWKNAYAVSNQGIEVTLKADVIRSENIRWNVRFNISRNWNRLEKSDNNRNFVNPLSPSNVSVIGKALNGLYVFDDRGFYTSQDQVPVHYTGDGSAYLGSYNQYYRPGDRIIMDVDKNGVISTLDELEDDRVYAGSPLPLAVGGIMTSLYWKGFDLNLTMPYSIGGHVLYAGTSASLGTDPGKLGPVFADLSKLTFWHEGVEKADYPTNRMTNGLNNFATNLKSNVYRVNYLKFKLISLGYTLPDRISKKVGFETRLFVSGENLFTVTNYPGPDPESIDPVLGIDSFDNYPLSRKFTFGITLKF